MSFYYFFICFFTGYGERNVDFVRDYFNWCSFFVLYGKFIIWIYFTETMIRVLSFILYVR